MLIVSSFLMQFKPSEKNAIENHAFKKPKPLKLISIRMQTMLYHMFLPCIHSHFEHHKTLCTRIGPNLIVRI